MAVIGKNGVFKFNGNDYSGDGNQIGMSFAMEAIEVTVFGISWKKFIEGMIEATLTFSAFYDGAVGATHIEDSTSASSGIFGVIGAQTTGKAFEYYPEQNTTGKVKYSGLAIMRRYQLDTRPNAVVTVAAEFVVSDVVTRTIL